MNTPKIFTKTKHNKYTNTSWKYIQTKVVACLVNRLENVQQKYKKGKYWKHIKHIKHRKHTRKCMNHIEKYKCKTI